MSKNILLCDDERHILRASEVKFHRAGFEVHCAGDGDEAWNMLTQPDAHFDILITDYQMPRMDGLELIKRVRESAALSGMPVILLTAKGFELDREELEQRLNIQKLVVKPFSPRELLMTVTRLLEEASATASAF